MVGSSGRAPVRMGSSPQCDGRRRGGQGAQARIVESVRNARYPNFVAFIATGVALGAIAGGLISTLSDADATTFTEGSALGYMVVTFAFLGAILGALTAVVADLLITRREGR